MAQVKGLLNIPGTGGRGLTGQVAQDPALGSSQIHLLQRGRYGLIGAPVEDANQMADMVLQQDHLQKGSVLRK